jgi:hypothetical protein
VGAGFLFTAGVATDRRGGKNPFWKRKTTHREILAKTKPHDRAFPVCSVWEADYPRKLWITVLNILSETCAIPHPTRVVLAMPTKQAKEKLMLSQFWARISLFLYVHTESGCTMGSKRGALGT